MIQQQITFLRRASVVGTTGLPVSTLYDLIKKGRFPKPIRITDGGRVAWIESEVREWQAARIAEREVA